VATPDLPPNGAMPLGAPVAAPAAPVAPPVRSGPPAGAVLTAPPEWQVDQRGALDEGPVLIDELDRGLDEAPRIRHRPRRGEPHLVEIFRGPRLRARTGWWRRLRSVVFLLVVTVFVALIVAGLLAGIVGGISYGISHAINNG